MLGKTRNVISPDFVLDHRHQLFYINASKIYQLIFHYGTWHRNLDRALETLHSIKTLRA